MWRELDLALARPWAQGADQLVDIFLGNLFMNGHVVSDLLIDDILGPGSANVTAVPQPQSTREEFRVSGGLPRN